MSGRVKWQLTLACIHCSACGSTATRSKLTIRFTL